MLDAQGDVELPVGQAHLGIAGDTLSSAWSRKWYGVVAEDSK